MDFHRNKRRRVCRRIVVLKKYFIFGHIVRSVLVFCQAFIHVVYELSESQKSVNMTFPANKIAFASFASLTSAPIHCLYCCFVSVVQLGIHFKSTVINRRGKSVEVRLKNAKHSWEKFTFWCFWSTFNKRGTHRAERFAIPKSWKM